MLDNLFDATKASQTPQNEANKSTNLTTAEYAEEYAELKRERKKTKKKLKKKSLSKKKRKKLKNKLKQNGRELDILRHQMADHEKRITANTEMCLRNSADIATIRRAALETKTRNVVAEIRSGEYQDEDAAVKQIIRLADEYKKIS